MSDMLKPTLIWTGEGVSPFSGPSPEVFKLKPACRCKECACGLPRVEEVVNTDKVVK